MATAQTTSPIKMALAQPISPIKLSDSPKLTISKRTDFSIETLLKKQLPSTSTSNGGSDEDETFTAEMDHSSHREMIETEDLSDRRDAAALVSDSDKDMATFSWLACTRFKPPKLQRSKKKGGFVRHGRGPRIPFAPHQIAVLESTFSKSQYLSSDCIHRLADTLHLSETRVKIWFQNRRARYRRERESPTMNGVVGAGATAQTHAQNLKFGDTKTLSPSKGSFDAIYPDGSDPDLNHRKCFSKRKLLIPDFITMQIQQHRQAQQLQYYLQQGFPHNSPLNLHNTSGPHPGFHFQLGSNGGLLPAEFGAGFNSAEAAAQLSRFLCSNPNPNSPIIPTSASVPMQLQMTFP